MSSIIKSISLDAKTATIAKRVPNFSRFVRECLLRWDSIERKPNCPVERLGHPLIGDFCIPSPTRICLKHWPKGTPSREDWRLYRDMVEFHEYHKDRDRLILAFPQIQLFDIDHPIDDWPKLWIANRAELQNHETIDFDEMVISGNAKPTKKKAKSRGWKRIFPFLQSRFGY